MMPMGTARLFLLNQPPWMLAQIYPDSSICSELPTKDFLIGKVNLFMLFSCKHSYSIVYNLLFGMPRYSWVTERSYWILSFLLRILKRHYKTRSKGVGKLGILKINICQYSSLFHLVIFWQKWADNQHANLVS